MRSHWCFLKGFVCSCNNKNVFGRRLSVKGASGLRPCVACANIVQRGSDLASRARDIFEIDCLDRRRLVSTSDADIWGHFDRLSAMKGTVSVAAFDRAEKVYGITHDDAGILADHALRAHFLPVSSLTFDWQHTYLSNGIASQEIGNFLGACKAVGIARVWSLLEQYCQSNWQCHKQGGQFLRSVHTAWNKTREKASSDHFKAGASEVLTVYPLLRRFAEDLVATQFPNRLRNEIESLVLLCRTLDMFQDAKGGPCDVNRLRRCVDTHLEKHKATYGADAWRPKHHFGMHIADQVERDQMVYDCFVVERSHQLVKHAAGPITNTGNFERSVIGRALLQRLNMVSAWDERPGPRGQQEPCPSLAEALHVRDVTLAAGGFYSGMVHNSGDILLLAGHMLCLSAFVISGDNLGVLGYAYDFEQRLSSSCSVWRPQSTHALLWLEGHRLRRAHAWFARASGSVVVLTPDLEW